MNSTADANNYYTNGYTFNPAGQIATLADGNGHVSSWTYDSYGNRLTKTDGNGVMVSSDGYDANSRLTSHWTPAKGLTQYTYDANGNPQTVVFNDGTGISAAYDGLNRIISMNDAVGPHAFTYQNFGAFKWALASESGPWASDTVTHTYANRLPQSLTLAELGGSWSENYGFDALQRLQTLTSPAGAFAYNYNGAGQQINTLALPGGNSVTNTFDTAGQLLTTALKNSGGTVLDSYGYAYDFEWQPDKSAARGQFPGELRL